MVDINERQDIEISDAAGLQNVSLTNLEMSAMDYEKLKKHIETLFLNENVINNIPLRVKMQNPGGWIPFTFLNYLKGKTHPNVKVWEQAIEGMQELFEIKDKKFRRKEMLPNMEVEIYAKSLLLTPCEGKSFDQTATQSQLKELLAKGSAFRGAHYRCIHPGEAIYARDVTRLLRQCTALRETAFVWLELKQGRSTQEALLKLKESKNTLSLHFIATSLVDYIYQQKKDGDGDSPRKRALTVSGEDSRWNGLANAKNKSSSNSRTSSAGFWTTSDNQSGWNQTRNNNNGKVSSNDSNGNKSYRVRSTHSECDSEQVPQLHKHASDGERPQFITRKSNAKGATVSQNGILMQLIRQPRGPGEEGFVKAQ